MIRWRVRGVRIRWREREGGNDPMNKEREKYTFDGLGEMNMYE